MRLTPPPARRSSAAFTLLEITIVLIIASMVISLGAMMVSSLFQEHAVAKTVTNIETLGLEAVKRSSHYQRHQAILFFEDHCELWDTRGDLVRRVDLPMGAILFIRRYYTKDFVESDGQRLDVIPGCLLEPIELVLKTGGEEFGFALDPLTGGYNPNW